MADDAPYAMGVPRDGWTYKKVCQIMFDPQVLLPMCAIIYDSDIDDAEKRGATGVAWHFAGIARGQGKT